MQDRGRWVAKDAYSMVVSELGYRIWLALGRPFPLQGLYFW